MRLISYARHTLRLVTMPNPIFLLKHRALGLTSRLLAALSAVVLAVCLSSLTLLSVAPAPAHAASAQQKQKAAKHAAIKNKHAARKAQKHGRKSAKALKMKGGGKYKRANYFVPIVPSVGVLSGLHHTPDPLALKSSVALVVDANTSQVLFEKNAHTALPIASITKLMTALVVVEAQQDLNERLTINQEDVNLEQRVRSKLSLGTEMSRKDALQLALMASENRAANMLSRYYPGGKPAFVDAMNRKAMYLGMVHTAFVEGTGLASANVASASDLVKLVKAAKQHVLIRELSTQANFEVADAYGRVRGFHTTNRLIGNPNWDITLQKTGFINAAGQCLVMASNLDGRAVIMVFLDSAGKLSRLGDAQRVRDWLTQNSVAQSNQPASPTWALASAK